MNFRRICGIVLLGLFLSSPLFSAGLELGSPMPLSSSGIETLKTFDGAGQSVKKFSVNFEAPFTGETGGFTALNVEGCSFVDMNGYQLPVKVIAIDLTKGSGLSSVKVTGGQWREIYGEFNLPPSSLPSTPGGEGQVEGGIDSLLPGTFLEAGEAKMAGGTIVNISIFPIQYNPVTKKAIFLQNADIELSYAETETASQIVIPMSYGSTDYSAMDRDLVSECIIITPQKYLYQANQLKDIHENQPLGPSITTRIFTTEEIARLNYGATNQPALAPLPDSLSPDGGFSTRTSETEYPRRKAIARSYNDRLARKILSFILDCHDAPGYENPVSGTQVGYYSIQFLQYIVVLGNASETPPSDYVYSTLYSGKDSYEHWIPTDYFYSSAGRSGMSLNPYTGVGRFPIAGELADEIVTDSAITALSTAARTITLQTLTDSCNIESGMTVVIKNGEAKGRWLTISANPEVVDAGGGVWNIILQLSESRDSGVAWMTEASISVGNLVDVIDTRPQMQELIDKVEDWVDARGGDNTWFRNISFAGGTFRNSFSRSETSGSSLEWASSSTFFWDELSCIEAINKVDAAPGGDGLSYVAGLDVRKYFATDIKANGTTWDVDAFIAPDVGKIFSNDSAHRAGILYFAGDGYTDFLSTDSGLVYAYSLLPYGTSTYNNFVISHASATGAFDGDIAADVFFASPLSFGDAALLSPAGAIGYFGPARTPYWVLNYDRAEDGLLIHSQQFTNELAMDVLRRYHRASSSNPTFNEVITKGLGDYYARNPVGSSVHHFRIISTYSFLGSPAIYMPGPGAYASDYEHPNAPTAEPLNPDRVNSDLVPCYEVNDGSTKAVSVSYSSEGSSNVLTLVDPRYYVGDDRITGGTTGTYNIPVFDDVDSGKSDSANGPGLYFVRVEQEEKNVDCYSKENRYYFELVNNFTASGDILVVDDDQPRRYTSSNLSGFDGGWQSSYPDFESYYTATLGAIGKSYKVWHVENKDGSNAAGQGRHGEVTQDVLDSYIGEGKAVVWFTGNDWFTTVLENERVTLNNFLDGGGKLFITGQDIGYQLRGLAFYQNVLRAGFAQDNIRLFNIDGIAIDDLSAGLQNITITGAGGANNQRWPSEIDPQNGSSPALIYNPSGSGGGARVSTGCAGIKYFNETTGGALVYFSFGFEAINDPSNPANGRSSVMSKVLNWLGSPTSTGVFSASPGDTEVYLTWTNPDTVGYPGVLIIARETDGYPTGVPVNGTAYAAGTAIGDGTVIYSQTPAGTSYTHTGLTNGVTYYYVAYVFSAANNYQLLGNANATPQEGGVGPGDLPAPTNLIATSSETGGQWQIDLSWQDNSADEDGFEIERKIGAGAFAPLATVGANVEAYTDGPPLAADTLYTYRVRAFRNDPPMVYSAWSNEASAATSILAAPTNLSVAGGEREAFLYWTNNSPGALGFEIQRSHLSPASPVHSFTTIGYAPAGSVSYRDELTSSPNIPDGRPYYYQIRAYDGVTQTDWSEIAWTNPIPSAFPYGEDPTNFEILPGWNTIVVRFNDNTTSESSYVMEFWKKVPNNIELPYAYSYLPAFAGATYHESAFEIAEGGTFYVRLIAVHSITDYGYSRYATPAGGGSGYVTIELPVEAGAGGSGGSCFIATAAFGSPYEKHVKTLRGFRDRHLLTNKPGRAFVRWYYRHSPSYADYIRRRPAVRAIVRTLLRPLAWLVGQIHPTL